MTFRGQVHGSMSILTVKIIIFWPFYHVFCIYLLERIILNAWIANGIDFTTYMDQDQGQGQTNNASLFNPYHTADTKITLSFYVICGYNAYSKLHITHNSSLTNGRMCVPLVILAYCCAGIPLYTRDIVKCMANTLTHLHRPVQPFTQPHRMRPLHASLAIARDDHSGIHFPDSLVHPHSAGDTSSSRGS